MSRNKDKKPLSTSAIFFITLVVTLTVLSIIFYLIFSSLMNKKKSYSQDGQTRQTLAPTEDDSFTLLILGADEKGLYNCEILYFDSIKGYLVFIPISTDTISQVNTKKSTVHNFYSSENMKPICTAIENLYSIPIQEYIVITPAKFNVLVTLMGRINVPPICDIDYTDISTGEKSIFIKDETTLFNSNQLLNLMNYPYYTKGAKSNIYMQGAISSELVNNFLSSDKDILSVMDTVYTDVILKTQSSITEYDFYSKKNSFLYMISEKTNPAFYSLPEWTENKNGTLSLSEDHISMVKNYINK